MRERVWTIGTVFLESDLRGVVLGNLPVVEKLDIYLEL